MKLKDDGRISRIPSSEAAKTERDPAKMVSNATALATHAGSLRSGEGGKGTRRIGMWV